MIQTAPKPIEKEGLASRRRFRRGFTLLEVLLALFLSSLVLLALVTAIDVHLRVVESGRSDVEEAQLARVLLERIADDLRMAIRYEPMDVTEMVPSVPSSGDSSGDAGDEPGGEPGGGGGEMGDQADSGMDEDESMSADKEGSSEATTSPQRVPGLYGESDWLQVDVARLPRLDQFDYGLSQVGETTIVERLSDVKTVCYYVAGQEYVSSTRPVGNGLQESGLVRRELDRAVTLYAEEQGMLADMESQLEPVAPEVCAIEFLYFDGTQWVGSWDSEAQGGLPVAVQIGLAIRPPGSSDEETELTGQDDLTVLDEEEVHVYYLVVHLPMGEPTSSDDSMASGAGF